MNRHSAEAQRERFFELTALKGARSPSQVCEWSYNGILTASSKACCVPCYRNLMSIKSTTSEQAETEAQTCITGVEEPGTLTSAATRQEGNCGCDHYRRRCKLVAPCCGDIFWCRHCHNEVKCQDEIVSLTLLLAGHCWEKKVQS